MDFIKFFHRAMSENAASGAWPRRCQCRGAIFSCVSPTLGVHLRCTCPSGSRRVHEHREPPTRETTGKFNGQSSLTWDEVPIIRAHSTVASVRMRPRSLTSASEFERETHTQSYWLNDIKMRKFQNRLIVVFRKVEISCGLNKCIKKKITLVNVTWSFLL